MEIERVSTGIVGLDEIMEGGLVKGSVNFLTGRTGTGKTAFSASFLYAGTKKGEKGLYVTTEETEEDIKNDIRSMFNWDFEELEEKGLIKFLSIRPELPFKVFSGEEVANVVRLFMSNFRLKIEDTVKKFKPQRVVIDSISIVENFIKDDYLRKVALMQFIDRLKELNVTSVLTGSIQEGSKALSLSGILEFLTDSVIILRFNPMEEFKRTIIIRKMRRTRHSPLIYPFEFTKNGIKIIEMK